MVCAVSCGHVFFTIASRVKDALMLPQVLTVQPEEGKIAHEIKADGVVEANLTLPQFTVSGIPVKSVYKQEGEKVKEGDILAEVVLEALEEKIAALKNEIAVLKLQKKEAEQTKQLESIRHQKNVARAKEDYEAVMTECTNLLAKAEQEEKEAGDALNAYLTQIDNGSFSDKSEEEIESEKQRIYGIFVEKQEALAAARKSTEEQKKTAERTLEDAKELQVIGYAEEITAIQLKEKEGMLDRLQELQNTGGQLTAEHDGTLAGVFLENGLFTPETAAVTIAVQEGGAQLSAVIGEDEAEHVSVGAPATVKKNGKIYEGFVVTSLQQQDDGYKMTVCADESIQESAEVFAVGERAEIVFTQKSENYQTVVPLTALHSDKQGDYLFVLTEKETVLGTQLYAMRIDVRVLEKNMEDAAVESGILNRDTAIIADSTQYIREGSRVRLREE